MTEEKKKEICHVCGREKEPYLVFMKDCISDLITHEMAREDGPICQRCDQYFAMTMTFKDATEEANHEKQLVAFSREVSKRALDRKDLIRLEIA